MLNCTRYRGPLLSRMRSPKYVESEILNRHMQQTNLHIREGRHSTMPQVSYVGRRSIVHAGNSHMRDRGE